MTRQLHAEEDVSKVCAIPMPTRCESCTLNPISASIQPLKSAVQVMQIGLHDTHPLHIPAAGQAAGVADGRCCLGPQPRADQGNSVSVHTCSELPYSSSIQLVYIWSSHGGAYTPFQSTRVSSLGHSCCTDCMRRDLGQGVSMIIRACLTLCCAAAFTDTCPDAHWLMHLIALTVSIVCTGAQATFSKGLEGCTLQPGPCTRNTVHRVSFPSSGEPGRCPVLSTGRRRR